MNKPNQRGSLTSDSDFILHEIDPDAPTEWIPHFPAGDKTSSPGSAKRSQQRAAGREGWTPFRPLDRNFKWRSGVCGDLKGRQEDHLKGGKYYHGGEIVATYRQGGILEVGLSIVAHHNGFIELHVCNVAKCPGGDISEECFRRGACQPVERARNPLCDSGRSPACGPIDRNHRNRWYLPCSRYPLQNFRIETYGPKTIQYRLPKHLQCEHCVLQWYWSSGNDCNADGVYDYFTGPDRPVQWLNSKCKGQAGAVGGVNLNRKTCGGRDFTEEYLQCADIRILPSGKSGPIGASKPPSKKKSPPKKSPPKRKSPPKSKSPPKGGSGGGPYDVSAGQRRGFGAIRDIIFVGDGKRLFSVVGKREVNVRGYRQFAIEAITESGVRDVTFSANGRDVTDRNAPFQIAGSELPRGNWFSLSVRSGSDRDSTRLKFNY